METDRAYVAFLKVIQPVSGKGWIGIQVRAGAQCSCHCTVSQREHWTEGVRVQGGKKGEC